MSDRAAKRADLDWFHLTLRITVLREFAQVLENYVEQPRQKAYEDQMASLASYRARDEINDLQFDAEGLETYYPNLRLTAISTPTPPPTVRT